MLNHRSKRVPGIVFVACGVLAMCGCGKQSSPAPADGTSSSTQVGGGPSTGAGPSDENTTGCGKAAPAGMTPGTHKITDFSGGGRDDRVYVVTIPEDYDSARKYALTLGFHPRNNRAKPRFDLDTTMAGESINVYPQSLDEDGVWDTKGDLDILYIDDLVSFFKESFCIDEQRVFAGGFSQGGRMSAVLGCTRGDIYRAVAVLAAGPPNGTEGDVSIEQCVGDIAYAHINGLLDPGRKAILDYYIELWRTRNNCSAETEAIQPAPCISYKGCDEPVIQCE
ncbi:MAG: hypothetical protein VB934_17145, partial [Polyangiaceae bacterium]